MRNATAQLLALALGLGSLVASSTLAAQAARPRRQSEVEATGERYAPAIRHCYQERGLKEDPMLRGKLRVGALVLPAGSVRNPTVTASEVHGLGMAPVVECVQAVASSWHFDGGAFRTQRVELLFDLAPLDR